MGLNTLTTATDGTVIPADHHNEIVTALSQILVPRNGSAVPTDVSGELGSSTYQWLKAFIASGYWTVGDIKPHHTYNGAAAIEHGWMICNGRDITEANYNTEHGAGTWATYISSSVLLNKKLPDLTDKYLVGAATTTQDGSVALTAVGNINNQIDISHSHTVTSHLHQWHTGAQSYDSGGSPITITAGASDSTPRISAAANTSGDLQSAHWTSKTAPGMNTQLSSSQDIRPESIEVQYYLRII